MSIIIENQNIKAGLDMNCGLLQIDFKEDGAYALGETVLLDLMQRSIGIIYQSTYHHIGDIPGEWEGKSLTAMTMANLKGLGGKGQEISLSAPVKIVNH